MRGKGWQHLLRAKPSVSQQPRRQLPGDSEAKEGTKWMSLASRATSLRLAWPAAERGSVFPGRVNPRRKTCQQHSGASQTAAVSPACARKKGNRGTGARGVWGDTFWQRQQGWSRVRKDTVVPNLVLLWHPATPSWLHPGVPACSCLFLPDPARSRASITLHCWTLLTTGWGPPPHQDSGHPGPRVASASQESQGDVDGIALPRSKAGCAQPRVLGAPRAGTLGRGEPGQAHPEGPPRFDAQ